MSDWNLDSHFARLDRHASRIIDRVNAIHFHFVPNRSTPNGRGYQDQSRLVLSGRGILVEVTGSGAVSAENGRDLQTRYQAVTHELSVDRSLFLLHDLEPRHGDRIEIGCDVYEVRTCFPDGMSRVTIKMMKVS